MAEIIKLDGLKELGVAMQKLSEDMQKKIARSATSAAATIVRKSTQQNIRARGLVDTGNLLKAVSVQRSRKTRLTSEHRVGVRSGGGYRNGDISGGKTSDVKTAKQGKGKLGVDAFYWSFLEFGTVKRGPTPFLAPALEQNKVPAAEAMAAKIKARIEKANK